MACVQTLLHAQRAGTRVAIVISLAVLLAALHITEKRAPVAHAVKVGVEARTGQASRLNKMISSYIRLPGYQETSAGRLGGVHAPSYVGGDNWPLVWLVSGAGIIVVLWVVEMIVMVQFVFKGF